jgi:crotonobetainyl-CoA:carnitine CoA-transferase CaiB-like acyl-CoA transferase
VLRQPALEGDERFRTNPDRVEHREELDREIAAVFGRLTAAEVAARLDAAGIAHARLNTVSDLATHPQHAARRRWREVGSPAGPIHALAPPVDLAGVDPAMGAVPALGQHTDAILMELGFSGETIAAWRRERTI